MSTSFATPASAARAGELTPAPDWNRLLPVRGCSDPTLEAIERELRRPETSGELEACEAEGRYPLRVVERLWKAGVASLFADSLPAGSPVRRLTAYHLGALNVITARRSASLAVAIGVNGLALLPVYMAATPEQWQRIRGRVQAGALGAILLTEWNHGSDLRANETVAEPGRVDAGRFYPCSGGGETHYRVRGEKNLINGASTAELLVTLARTGASPPADASPFDGATDMSLLLVHRDPGGVSSRSCATLAVAAADIGHVRFRDVLVPVRDRIGAKGEGFRIVQRTLQLARGGIGSFAAGSARQAAETAWSYAGARRLYGRPILELDPVAEHLFRLSALELALSALSLKATAAINALGTGASYFTAVAKLACAELAEDAVAEGRRVLSARSLLPEAFGRLVRDVPLYGIFDGTGHVMRQELQWRLQQMVTRRAPEPDPVAEIASIYARSPQSMRTLCRRQRPAWLPDVRRHARRLAELGGVGGSVRCGRAGGPRAPATAGPACRAAGAAAGGGPLRLRRGPSGAARGDTGAAPDGERRPGHGPGCGVLRGAGPPRGRRAPQPAERAEKEQRR